MHTPGATRSGHVALAGLPNVGKSSLLNALVGEHLAIVSPKAQATRLPVVGLVTRGSVQFVLHDLPGLLRQQGLWPEDAGWVSFGTLTHGFNTDETLHPPPTVAPRSAAG